MKRVVIVAPSFAPSSNPPTHRVRFFAKHLPTFGWHPHVLAVDPAYYEEPLDAEIGRFLPPELAVSRSAAIPARYTRPLAIGDLGMRAYFPMKRALRALCEREQPDLLFIPGPPWHTFGLGRVMQQERGIPYVLDYIDPWVDFKGADGRWWKKAYWFRRMALALEPAAVRGASHIVAVSNGTNDHVRARYPDLPAAQFTEIPYGFEPSDFDVVRDGSRANAYWKIDDGNFHLVYVGAMLPKGYETLRALFGALLLLREQAPEIAARLRLHFFGTTYEPNPVRGLVGPVAAEMGVGDVVTEHPARIPYLDALNVMCAADGILALGSSEAHYTASKIFPSILAKRPLLAIYHAASSVCDVLRQSCAGYLVTYDDDARAEERIGEIANALKRIAAGEMYDQASVRWDSFAQYSAESMTQRLAAVFDRVMDQRWPRVPQPAG